MGACFGFLWWNASPAKIFMGDTGSLAIGGAFAGIAIVTQTELLLIVLGGLFVIETLSVIMQIGVFKLTRKRVFNMAPIHHHFELAGWVENTVIVRFWIIAGLAVAFGLGVFYAEYLVRPARCGDARATASGLPGRRRRRRGQRRRGGPGAARPRRRASPSPTPARSGPSRCARTGFAVVAADEPPPGTALVVTSPGWRPDAPLLVAAAAAGIEVIGRGRAGLAAARGRARRPGSPLTGTNGKTTTVRMLAAS